ncbi:MAG TPA: 6-bladed beta-propeller [Sedimentisphaerales bacterium]|nr:6-bladed beta-propeller [Sedimentisphaerales bacterium]
MKSARFAIPQEGQPACDAVPRRLLTSASLALWAAVIFLPLLIVFTQALRPAVASETGRVFASALRSFALAAVIAAVAVLLGYIPGRLLGTCRTHRDLLLLLLLMPLVLPQHVLYYAWTLLLSPTTELGKYMGARPELARFVGTFSSCLVLILWHWPLAALLIAQGWRNIDRQIWDCASLDAGAFGRFKNITLPLLTRPVLLAFGVCFALSLSEFTTFHLAGIRTIGTELAVLYQQTGSESDVARAAWPAAAVALIVAFVLGKSSGSWASSNPLLSSVECESQKRRWIIMLVLVGISLVVPVVLLAGNVTDSHAFRQFLTLHMDELGWSLAIAAGSALIAHFIAFGALRVEGTGIGGLSTTDDSVHGPHRLLSFMVRTTIFLAMFLPASLIAVGLLKMMAVCGLPAAFRQGWYIVSAGQAARFTGVALILLILTRYSHERRLSEMASLDGASAFATWRHVHLPRTWPLFLGSFILIIMLSITELSATMVLLPAGLPNFAQRLLNQMHYARDQQVIASCLVLTCLFLVCAGAVVLLLRAVRLYRQAALLIFAVCVLGAAGCDDKSFATGGPKVLYAFGQTGRGQAEFIYPRAIEITGDGSLLVVDKTGRIQRFTAEGKFLSVIHMPLTEAGFPTGLSIAPNGDLYVADTHYHRVVVFSADGKLINELGRLGQEGGCFIYPTDVAFSSDGRIYVSEYGGNDRVSVFNDKAEFLYSFGAPGSGVGQFARPSALCVDAARKRLYVADACNHRVAIYNLDGTLLGYIGSAGRASGELRYPYDLAFLSDGTLVVCEYGNNRLQLFSPDGRSLAVYGSAGRQLGQLAYPWGVSVDGGRRAFVVDAGNNRIQVWQL